jgi:indoleamine 2,3-dioxygenase
MACSFTGTDDETGFIMVHVDINQHSPLLLKTCDALLEDFHHSKNPTTSLGNVVGVLQAMNASRKKMWEASRWERYNDFRVFIMGSQGNPRIFPNGVVYEPETAPRVYRGQSGSQDTIIPFLDTLFRVSDYYPENELTGYLMDMRKYRPKPFRDLLQWVDKETRGLVEWVMTWKDSLALLCEVYHQIYEFRNGHWHFVQKYIMANTRYPVATGGTPIVTWLPNQIHATLAAMKRVLDAFPTEPLLLESRETYEAMVKDLEKQKEAIHARYD